MKSLDPSNPKYSDENTQKVTLSFFSNNKSARKEAKCYLTADL